MKSTYIFVCLFLFLIAGTAQAQPFSGGDGSVGNPYEIENVDQLQAMKDYLDKHFILTADIDASETASPGWGDGAGFEPVGTNSGPFMGSLDGNGHKIKGLTINRLVEDYVGLFGFVGATGSILGVALEDVSIASIQYVGGLVGYNYGTIKTSHVTGSVSGAIYVGGLVGSNEGTIKTSYATGSVSGTGGGVGGLVGGNYHTIETSYATGNVSGTSFVGGLVGENYYDIKTSYATGEVSGSGIVGGLVGENYDGLIETSYWNTGTTGQDNGASSGTPPGATGLPDNAFRDAGSFEGFDFDDVWTIEEGSSYPYLRDNPQVPPPGMIVVINPDENGILYVNKSAAGNGSGDSWENAIPELADALKWAREQWTAGTAAWDDEHPLQIWVAAGRYLPTYKAAEEDSNEEATTDRDKAFVLVPHVQLYGGFAGTETGDGDLQELLDARDLAINQTILSGDIGDESNADNAYHVVIGAGNVGTALLDGLTLSGGNANGSSAFVTISVNGQSISRMSGGGIVNYGASPKLTRVTISGNTASTGGGMTNYNSSSPVLIGMMISDNTATTSGGGIYNFSSSNPKLTNVTISGNAANSGGGIFIGTASPLNPLKLTNVVITGNTASSSGGGIFISNSNNVALTNLTVSGNTASDNGGGINIFNSSVGIDNSIIWGNTAGTNGNQLFFNRLDGTLTVRYSLYANGAEDMSGDAIDIHESNLHTDPQFVGAVAPGDAPTTGGDYRLAVGSPAIDAGSNVAYTDMGGDLGSDLDLGDNPRLYGATIDMGAYEFAGVPITPDDNHILYVKGGASGTGSGDSWGNAIPELADALKWAREQWEASGEDNEYWNAGNPLKIFVAAGTYKPLYHAGDGSSDGDRDNVFVLVPYVQLYGGFAGTEIADDGLRELLAARDFETNTTILSGDLNSDDNPADPTANKSDNAYHVVIGVGIEDDYPIDELVVLDGFSITGGNANGYGNVSVNGADISQRDGGGMLNSNSSPRLTNVLIDGNSSATFGGGMRNVSSSPILDNVVIAANSANHGGGISNQSANPKLTNVTISGNSVTGNGGGSFDDASSPVLLNVVISGNEAGIIGGGLFYQNGGEPILTNVAVTGNVIRGLAGGGITASDALIKLVNVTVSGNVGGGISGSSVEIYNSIVWDNNVTFTNFSGTLHTSSSNNLIEGLTGQDTIRGTVFEGSGADLFVQFLSATEGAPVTGGDYRLLGTSVAIDVGKNEKYTEETALGEAVDLAGDSRIYNYGNGGIIDLGAYEYEGVQVIPPFYVKVGGTGSGSSWDDAYGDLQNAINAAQLGRQIWVAAGTYLAPSSGSSSGFRMKNGVSIYGGFIGNETSLDQRDWTVNETVLSGNGITRVINNDFLEAYRIRLQANALLDGFVITDGVTGDSGNLNSMGGGVFNMYASPTLKNLIISGNEATICGGGIYNTISSPILTNVVITGNTALEGGGIYNTDSSNPTLTGVIISGNTASNNGGGMTNARNSSPTLVNITISGNTASNNGGGIYNWDSSPEISNSVVWRNTAGVSGGQFYSNEGSTMVVRYSLYGNDVGDVDGGAIDADESNLHADPKFTDAANGDYTLSVMSPAINAGSNAAYASAGGDLENDHDLGGGLRLKWETIDMGAYEYQLPLAPVLGAPVDKTYKIGDALALTVDFHAAVMVDGEPTLALTVGEGDKAAVFTGLSDDGQTATFTYTVAEGDLDADGIVPEGTISVGDGSIAFTDSGLGAVLLTYTASALPGVKVDGVRPALTAVSIASDNATETVAKVGDQVTVTFTASEGIGEPEVEIAGQAATVSAVDGEGRVWKAEYMLAAGDAEGIIGFAISELADIAGNTAADVTATMDESSVTFDKTAPVVTGVEDGTYNVDVTPVFEEGAIATLNGEEYGSGTVITLEGNYILAVTDTAGNVTTVSFTIDKTAPDTTPPVVTGVEDGGVYNGAVTPAFDEGTATLNGQPFTSGTAVTEDGDYELVVTDAAGNKTTVRFTVGGLPGLPTGLSAVAGNKQVGLSWLAPEGEFLPITDYVIAYSHDGGQTWTTAGHAGPAGTQAVVIGLVNNRSYRFRVAAVNALGTGPFSDAITDIIPTEPVPDADGGLPEPEPGTTVVITDGKVEAITIEVVDGEYLRLSGEGYALELASLGADGGRVPISAVDAVIRLVRGTGTQVYVSGHGFEPGTVVTVYLFSVPELVGHLPVGADGSFAGTLPVPVHLALGRHTLQVNGVVAGGGERSVSIGLLLVENKSQTIGFGALTDRTYGDDPITLNGNASSGLPVSYAVTDTEGNATGIATLENGNELHIHGAGDILITASQDGDTEYAAATPVARTLHIAKAPLGVSVADAARAYGEANPVFEVSYRGFVNDEDASSLTTQPSAASVATAASGVGSYPITLGGGQSPNYEFIYHGGTLVVTKASQAIAFNAPAEVNRGAGNIVLDVSATGGLPVTLSVDDPQVATVSGNTLAIHRLGTVRITAVQEGDGNHEAAEPVTVTIRVVDPTAGFAVKVHPAVSPNGDGINEFLMVEGIRDYPDNKVTIFNRNGTVVYEAEGYDNDRVAFRGMGTGQIKLSAGTYFYVVEVKADGRWEHHKGYFVLRY